jgi:nitrate/nitrite-specific signal transduction histidine kinase
VSDGLKRAQYFLHMLEEGKQFTQELLKENESLRLLNLKLRSKLREVEANAQAHDLSKLKEHLAKLEAEKQQIGNELSHLQKQLASIEEENREFAERYVRIERQNGNLASLYVASYNLHTTLDFEQIVQHVREIVINLIGSEQFGVFLADGEGKEFALLAHEGLEDGAPRLLKREGVIGRALDTRQSVFVSESEHRAGAPLVSIPLVVDDSELGVIVIYRLLDHKNGLESLDRELIDLLAGQAATAVYASRLYAESERKRVTLQGFFDLLKARAQ